ncbi:hypothetical protein Tco_0417275 [Tanacetum coccineum]
MDDLNITMEEYIKLEEEKARRHGQMFNWQTATFEKVKNYEVEDDCSIDFETEFLAIVFDNTLTTISSEPTVCPPNENEVDFRISLDESDDEYYTNVLHFNDLFNIIHPDDLKSEKDNDDNDIDIIHTSEGNEITPGENGLSETNMTSLPAVDQRHPWLRYQIEEYTEGIRHNEARFGSEIKDGVFWRGATGVREMSDTEMGLDVADTLCFLLGGVRRRMTWRYDRLILNKGGLRDYWIEISSGRDFLGPAPSYVLIRDPARRLCHKMTAYSISGRGRHLRRHAEGRKSRDRLLGGYFIGRLAIHFGLAWVAQGPERQQAAAAGAHEANEAGLAAEEVASEIPAPAQAPLPPPPAPLPRTMSQRIERIKEEMHDLWHAVIGLRGVVESFTTEQSRVST